MPAADKKPTGKKKTALAKSAPPASATPAVPAGPDPIVVLSYQLGMYVLSWLGCPMHCPLPRFGQCF